MNVSQDPWATLGPSENRDALTGRQLPDTASAEIRAAIDHDDRRHLLVRVPNGSENVPKPRTRGLQVTVCELHPAGHTQGTYLDVECVEPAALQRFTTVCADILDEIRRTPDRTRDAVRRVLHRWGWFWAVPGEGLGREDALGLFGELWFLDQWISRRDADALRAWTGPFGDRHDFKSTSTSVEVKTTRAVAQGAPSHQISNLDQLDSPEQGELYLFSLRVRPDPIGRNNLTDTIARLETHFRSDPDTIDLWEERLGRAGYSPAHADRYTEGLVIVAQELYHVTDGFPRITRATFPEGIPAGIDDIGYSLNLSACQEFQIATGPHEHPVRVALAGL